MAVFPIRMYGAVRKIPGPRDGAIAPEKGLTAADVNSKG
jgi:hypothetical protein